MGRHRKPTHHHTRNLLIVTAPILGLPLTTGTAHAAPLDWDSVKEPLARCESGNNPKARNPTSSASGKWQLINGTWAANGGRIYARTAAQATVAEQEIVAKRLFLRLGLGPWNASKSCWRHLIGKLKAKPVKPIPTPPGRAYTVVRGDTLSDIAERTGHTWEQLLEANKATVGNPNLIHVGLSINLL